MDASELTRLEGEELKAELRALGREKFMKKYLSGDDKYSVKEVLYAFGYVVPDELWCSPEMFLNLVTCLTNSTLALFSRAIETELERRERLKHVNTIDDIVGLIKKSSNIIVLAGAGISTSCGIPDFRSDKGIYAMLADMGLDDPSDMFDIEVFRQDPSIFYTFAKKILPATTKFSPTHGFLRLLQDKNKLLRVYTQNIDNLERLAGVRDDKLVQCHGSFATASCMRCKLQVPIDEIKPNILDGIIPKCRSCEAEREQQSGRKRKRKRGNDWEDDDDDEDDNIIEGIMKPDITFFGEMLPEKFSYTLLGSQSQMNGGDAKKCDLLICIGTSLQVAPVLEIVRVIPHSVPQVYISKVPVNHMEFDVTLLGHCDEITRDLVRRCGYTTEHEILGGTDEVDEYVQWREVRTGMHEIVKTGPPEPVSPEQTVV